MPKTILIRDVPDAFYGKLEAQAAAAGISLSDYLLSEITEIAERPTMAEMRKRLHRREPVVAAIDIALMVRDEREGR